MTELNIWNGRISIYYLDNALGEKNLPDENPLRPVRLSFSTRNQPEMCFNIDYPGIPFFGDVRFNLNNFSSNYEDLQIYRLDAVKLDENSFIILLNYVWTYPTNMENFETVSRFNGPVPEVLRPRLCPALDLF
jgi:hypothetical protein